ncbi:hypothetical protein C8R45DRAFT_1188849 [Mycena sanguinolenta]|nr:hypothetical protein C8R45DRAFT_1188849 [Mycena sanguinolenta]
MTIRAASWMATSRSSARLSKLIIRATTGFMFSMRYSRHAQAPVCTVQHTSFTLSGESVIYIDSRFAYASSAPPTTARLRMSARAMRSNTDPPPSRCPRYASSTSNNATRRRKTLNPNPTRKTIRTDSIPREPSSPPRLPPMPTDSRAALRRGRGVLGSARGRGSRWFHRGKRVRSYSCLCGCGCGCWVWPGSARVGNQRASGRREQVVHGECRVLTPPTSDGMSLRL